MDLSKETTAPKTATRTPKGEPWAVPVGEETDVNGKPAPSGREGPCAPREGAEEAGPPPPCRGSPRSPVRCVLAFLRDKTRASGRAPIHPSGCWGSCESSTSSRIGRSWREDQKGEASRGFQGLPEASGGFQRLLVQLAQEQEVRGGAGGSLSCVPGCTIVITYFKYHLATHIRSFTF